MKDVPVLFLDIDGTVRHGKDELGRFVNTPDDVVIFPDAVDRMSEWRDQGGRIIGVTNQAGVALGHLDFDTMIAALLETDRKIGKLFDNIEYCIHAPAAGCWCRKPQPGLITAGVRVLERVTRARNIPERYPQELMLMVGDRPEDQQAAAAAGIRFMWAHDWRAGHLPPERPNDELETLIAAKIREIFGEDEAAHPASQSPYVRKAALRATASDDTIRLATRHIAAAELIAAIERDTNTQLVSMRDQHRVTEQFKDMVMNLDRCPHGRHAGDTCAGWRGPGQYEGGCHGGISLGNPLLPPGTVLGNAWRQNGHYQIPDHNDRNKPEAWIVPNTGTTALIPPRRLVLCPRCMTLPIGHEGDCEP